MTREPARGKRRASPAPSVAGASALAPRGTRNVRVFFAIWPDRDAHERLAALAQDVAARTRGRAPRAGNLHVTVAFIGEIAPERIDALCAIGATAAARAAPFVLTLDCAGTFRGTGIAWAGASMPPAELARLARDLADALTANAFAVEGRAFTPHVTLARRCTAPTNASVSAPIAWTVTRLVLNTSEPTADGPHYRVVAAWPLGLPATGGSPS